MLLQAVLFALFAAIVNPTFDEVNSFLSKLKSPSGFFPLLSFLLAVIFEGLIHSNKKAMLVFWRTKNPLPGCTAFSDIAPNDPRISMTTLKKMFPEGFPEDPKEQNAVWYDMYKQHKNKPIVYDAHRFFLLTRDLAAMTVILMPFCVVAHLFWHSSASAIGYHLLILVIIAVLICLSAQNYGKRLVENVFAEATTEKGKDL